MVNEISATRSSKVAINIKSELLPMSVFRVCMYVKLRGVKRFSTRTSRDKRDGSPVSTRVAA